MNAFFVILRRDLRLSWRMGGGFISGAMFMLMLTLLLPLALGPNLVKLAALAVPLLWIGSLLASLLTLDRLFQADDEDGTLDLFLGGDVLPEILALSKISAHWLVCGAPLVLLSPLYGMMLGLAPTQLPLLALSLAIGTPALSALGSFGAALTLNLKRGGLLLPLLVLPLTLPLLVFGTFCAEPLELTMLTQRPFALFCGMSLLALALAPLGTAAALRASRT